MAVKHYEIVVLDEKNKIVKTIKGERTNRSTNQKAVKLGINNFYIRKQTD